MNPLATLDQLEALTGLSLDMVRADRLLRGASAAVRSYTGQTFTRETTTDRIKVTRGGVRLPQRPVNDVTAVADVNGNPLLFDWQHGDKVTVSANLIDDFAWEPWRTPVRWVDVTYDHGFDDIPDDIIEVVCQVAGRAYGTSPQDSALNQETLGSYNYSTGAAASNGVLGFLTGERAVLDRYRRQTGTVGVDR